MSGLDRRTFLAAASGDDLGLTRVSPPRGAGHDAQALASLTRMGMIFVPSVGGFSHSPREFTRRADAGSGADVLLQTIVRLDAEPEEDAGRG